MSLARIRATVAIFERRSLVHRHFKTETGFCHWYTARTVYEKIALWKKKRNKKNYEMRASTHFVKIKKKINEGNDLRPLNISLQYVNKHTPTIRTWTSLGITIQPTFSRHVVRRFFFRISAVLVVYYYVSSSSYVHALRQQICQHFLQQGRGPPSSPPLIIWSFSPHWLK